MRHRELLDVHWWSVELVALCRHAARFQTVTGERDSRGSARSSAMFVRFRGTKLDSLLGTFYREYRDETGARSHPHR